MFSLECKLVHASCFFHRSSHPTLELSHLGSQTLMEPMAVEQFSFRTVSLLCVTLLAYFHHTVKFFLFRKLQDATDSRFLYQQLPRHAQDP